MAISQNTAQKLVKGAVTRFWQVREAQTGKQKKPGKLDQGFRGAVTGGAQMDGISREGVPTHHLAVAGLYVSIGRLSEITKAGGYSRTPFRRFSGIPGSILCQEI